MAFSNNTRSFTTFGPSTSSESKSNGSTIVPGSTNPSQAWNAGNIWGSGGISNGFGSRATTRDNSRSSDLSFASARSEAEVIEGKTGSGSLVDSSVSDGWSHRASYGSKRSMPSSRSISHAKYPESNTPQQRSVSNAGLPQPYSTNFQTLSPFGTRPQTVNLNATTSGPPHPSFGSSFSGNGADRGSAQPPTVYTKFDRPTDPNLIKPDSAKSLWPESSPTEERMFQLSMQYGSRNGSLPTSRDGSLPPLRHGDERPTFSRPDYSRTTQRPPQNTSRTPSLSSQTNGSYGSFVNPGADQLPLQFNQLSLNANSRSMGLQRPFGASNAPFGQAPVGLSSLPFSRQVLEGVGGGFDGCDEIEEVERPGMTFFGADGYVSPHQSHNLPEFAPTTFAGRFSQTPTNTDFGHLPPYSNGQTLSHANGLTNASRASSDWQGVSNGSLSSTRRSPALQEQPQYLNPGLQPMIPMQVGIPYGPLYNRYGLPNTLNIGPVSPYGQILTMQIPGMDAASASGNLAGEEMRSALMYEFKSNSKAKRYELKDIYDHIAEFSGDQHGSRFIQTKLESANSDEKERVFREIEPNALPLMTDVFGNYVIQKFFEHGDQTHKKTLANTMKGHVLTLSLQMYGCRVVQKALDHVLVDQQRMLISELDGQVLKCVKDQNGNHVVQKAIERCPPNTISFVIAAFHGQVQHLSIHPYGCRVIQRCLERCEPQTKGIIMAELMEGIQTMISDQYGNYVVQHVVEHDDGEGRRCVLDIVGKGLEAFSKHKFASNVVEKCLEKSDDMWRRQVLCSLASADQRRCEGEGVLVGLIKDNFGNYVIQKLLDTLCPEDYGQFLELLQPAMTQAKRTGCGKQVLSIEKKMHRFPPFRNGPASVGAYNPGPFQMALPTPPFNSHYGSAATTPPPALTSDTQSLQSSAIPSVNGDAIEGAIGLAVGSRKGSELSNHDGHYMR